MHHTWAADFFQGGPAGGAGGVKWSKPPFLMDNFYNAVL
jgi:hypothetical protein